MPGLKRQPPTEKQEENTFKIPDTHIYPACSPQLPITHLPSEKAEPCRTPLSNEMQLCLHRCLWRLEKSNSDFPGGLSPRGQYLDMLPTLCYSSLILYLLSSGAELCENCAASKKHQQPIRWLVKNLGHTDYAHNETSHSHHPEQLAGFPRALCFSGSSRHPKVCHWFNTFMRKDIIYHFPGF